MATLSPGLQQLLSEPASCQISTLMPNGEPQITQVWVDSDGDHILVNTAEGRQKTRNIARDARVAVQVIDPGNAWRLATIRGRVVDVTPDGADEHIDRLAKKYLGVDSYPFRRADETRLTLKILPDHISEMGLDESA